MVSQFALPRSMRQGRQDVRKVGITRKGPELLKHLAEKMFKGGADPREVYARTGWLREPGGELVYNYADQGMKIREDNRLLMRPSEEPYATGAPIGTEAEMREQPGIPMKEGTKGYTTRGGETKTRYGSARLKPGESLEKGALDLPPGPLPAKMVQEDPTRVGTIDFSALDPSFNQPAGMTRGNLARAPTFEELFEHPLQQQYQPELGGIPVHGAHYTFSPDPAEPSYGGSFSPLVGYKDPNVPYIPGDVSRSAVGLAKGPLGGVNVPYSMPSVALHEAIGHGGQRLEQLPEGGMGYEPGMMQRSLEVQKTAKQRLKTIEDQMRQNVAHLVAGGVSKPTASRMVLETYPGYLPETGKYSRAVEQKELVPTAGGRLKTKGIYDPAHQGYLAESGEAAARNLQTRAADLTSAIPYRGEPRVRRHEGDVHPLETYDMPPDLLRNRIATGLNPGRTSLLFDPNTPQPSPGQYDWLLTKAPAAGAAATAATLASTGAEAAEGASPKQGRITRDDVSRISSPFRNAPTREEQIAVGPDIVKSILSSLRSSAEAIPGLRGDVQEMIEGGADWLKPGLGKYAKVIASPMSALSEAVTGYPTAPTSEQVGQFTDWLQGSPDDWTRHQTQTPEGQAFRTAADWTLDPLDLLLPVAGKGMKAAKKFVKGVR
jgi:hypothetical protein